LEPSRECREESGRSPSAGGELPKGRGPAVLLLPALLALAGYAANLGDFFLSDDLGFLFSASHAGTWSEASRLGGGWNAMWIRPVPLWTFWLQLRVHGATPWPYHAFDLAFHVLNAGLVGLLAAALTRRRDAGPLAAALFSVCPIHPEAVTWISGRFDVLAATGTLACLLAWARYLGTSGRGRHLALSALALAFGLACKEMALAALPLLAGTAWLLRAPRARALRGLAILGGLVGAYLGLRCWMLGGVGGYPERTSGQATFFAWPVALRFLPRAFALCFVPAHYADFPQPWHPLKLLPATVLAVATLRAVRRRGPAPFLRELAPLLVLFALSLAPVIGWTQLHADLQGSRFLYLPSALACTALATVLVGGAPQRRSFAVVASTLVVGAWLAGLLLVNRHWSEAARTAEAMVRRFPADTARPIWVTDLPDHHHGAYVLRNHFDQGVALFVDPGVDVRVVGHRAWDRELSRRRRKVRLLRWDRESGTWSDVP